MIDDHKYSVGRTVVFRLPDADQGRPRNRWSGRASGMVRAVRLVDDPERWVYTIERQRTKEQVQVDEDDVLYGVIGKRRADPKRIPQEESGNEEQFADMLSRMASESALVDFLRTTVRDLVKREQSEETARKEGRELPLGKGDYIRVRGDLREEMEQFHNYYGKIIDILGPDIAGLEAMPGRGEGIRTYRVVRRYRVLLDDGHEVEIYDPEVKLYYTANGRSTILNWRAATFLAEAFGDEPPYKVEFSYLEDHVFSRDELTGLTRDQLAELLASILYVKGHMGWRDFEEQHRLSAGLPTAFLVDSILAASRFDQRKNRPMTPEEIEERRRQTRKFKELLGT